MDFYHIISTSGTLCSLGKSIFGSTYSFLWSIGTFLGFWKCAFIILLLILWIIWEIFNRNTHSYNSENGFTPEFNVFIGVSTYFWFQTAIYFILDKIFTEVVYCFKTPYFIHIGVFLFTGFFLHMTGVWPYWKIFGKKVRIK